MQPTQQMRGFTIQAAATINAPLERVWSVIVDLPRYSAWNAFVPSMQSSLQVGSTLTMGVQMKKNLHIKIVETVTVVEPLHQLAWKARFPTWYLHSERFQTLTALDTDTTHYTTHETFTGLMAPFLRLMLGKDLQRGFDSIALNLKRRAELPDV